MASTADSSSEFDAISLKLFNYLLDHATSSSTPLKVRALCREFKETIDGTFSVEQLLHRAHLVRGKIHELKDVDLETKVRLLFCLSGPINEYFMKEIRESGDVTLEVDDLNRITKYDKKGGLKLAGSHTKTGYRAITDDDRETLRKMMASLAEKSRHATVVPIVTNTFLLEFKEQTGNPSSTTRLLKRLNTVRETIYASTEYDRQHRIRMLFVSGAKIPECVLKELQIGATVCLDNESRIIEYIADDKSLQLIGDHNGFKKRASKSFGVPDDFEMDVEEDNLDDDDEDVPGRRSALRKRGQHEEPGSTNAKRSTPTRRSNEPSTSSNPVRQDRSAYEERADDNLPVLPIRRQVNHSMPVDIKAEEQEREHNSLYNDFHVPEINDNKHHISNGVHDESSTSARKVLEALRSLVCTLDSPLLENLQESIEVAIGDQEEKQVPLEALTMVVQSSLMIANISASEEVPSEESEGLREFLRLYQCSLYSLGCQSLDNMHNVFKDYIAKLKTSNKRITMKKIRAVIESVLALVV